MTPWFVVSRLKLIWLDRVTNSDTPSTAIAYEATALGRGYM